MSRKTSLVRNIITYGLGTSLSKLMSVLLVGLYTVYISTADLGYYDWLFTVAAMLMPLISLQIIEALYRQLLDEDTDPARAVSNAFIVVAAGLAVSTAVSVIVNTLADIRLGWILPGFFATAVLLNLAQQTARGLRRNTVYAVSGIAYTGVMLVSNIVMIAWMKMGIEALFYSIMIADVFGILYIEAAVGVFRRIRFSLLDSKLLRAMCRYSIPLLPNAITWWALMLASRTAVIKWIGVEANGIYAVSAKFPALLITVFNVFGLAWQESAITEYASDDRNNYFSKTFNLYMRLLLTALLVLLPVTRLLTGFLVGDAYYSAWQYIPFLYMGSIFQAFAQFYATGYFGARKTAGAFTTTLIGVLCGAACLALIPVIGLQAASLAQMTAYLAMLISRMVHTRKYIRVKIDLPVLILLTALTAVYVICCYQARFWLDIPMFAAAVVIFLIINRGLIRDMLGMLGGIIRKRGGGQ